MRGMNSECVDLIYLDPPFNSKTEYAAPIGSRAAGAAFKDTWTLSDVDVEWINLIAEKMPALHSVLLAAAKNSSKSYLAYMAVRLIEMHRILKPTGSIYLHCDPVMAHYLKLVMDAIFGEDNFRNAIIWQRYGGRAKGSQHQPKTYGVHDDNILFYARSAATKLHPYRPATDEELASSFPKIDQNGRRFTTIAHFRGENMGDRPNLCYTWRGFTNPHSSGWRVSKERLQQEYEEGKVVIRNGKLQRRRYYDETKGIKLGNLWSDIPPPPKAEETGYPTQKPLALLERIIKASSRAGDMILDPFCGCATTCVAADGLGRQWAGIDISTKAVELVRERIDDTVRDIIHRTDIPLRLDSGRLPRANSPENKKRLYGEQSGHCAGCRHHFEAHHLEVDHIISKGKGGSDHIENLQLLCSNCNRVKGQRGMEYLQAKLRLR